MNKDRARALEALKRSVPDQRGSEEIPQASKQTSKQTEGDLKPFSSYLPSGLIKRVKLLATEQDRTVREVLQEAIEAYLAQSQQ